jgi:two-component system, LytTR family, response regulator AlgR
MLETAPDHPPLRVLIVDDEEPARWRLRSLLEACDQPRCEVVGEAANAVQARVWLSQQPCDLLLLDIALPGTDGLSFADELRTSMDPTNAPALIFVTAHAEHALQAFELAASDYLTKPVRRERLQAALQRVAGQVALRRGQPPPTLPGAAELVVSDRGRVLRLRVADVLYLKAELKYVTVRTRSGSHLLDDSLSDLEARLGDGFIRIHRNALVARDAVRSLERRAIDGEDEAGGWAVWLPEIDEWLAVSRRQLQGVREVLQGSERRR